MTSRSLWSACGETAARRGRVLQAALKLGAEGGYDAVQMRDVAARAQVALGIFFVLACQCMSTIAVVRRVMQDYPHAPFRIVVDVTLPRGDDPWSMDLEDLYNASEGTNMVDVTRLD